jgi:hypothetical protein
MAAPELDRWIAGPEIHTRHSATAAADPDALWRAAASVRLGDSRLLGGLVRWRVAGVSGNPTYRETFRSEPFMALEEGPRHLLSGLCGAIWRVRGALEPIGTPERFREWAAPETARVLFGHWVEPAENGGSVIFSDVRVAAVDRPARSRLRLVGPLVRACHYLIRAEALELAVRRADGVRR